jgi:hypothetical protein
MESALEFASGLGSGSKTSPRTQTRRWGKPFNPQHTRCMPAVKRIFPALILGPMEAFETTSGTWFQNLSSNPNSVLCCKVVYVWHLSVMQECSQSFKHRLTCHFFCHTLILLSSTFFNDVHPREKPLAIPVLLIALPDKNFCSVGIKKIGSTLFVHP